jgi:hypothetical protein
MPEQPKDVEPIDMTEETGLQLTQMERATIDVQIATAKQYPRSVTKALHEAEGLATLNQETAGSCFYSLPRAGKRIEGPSARFAEIIAYSWGNLRADGDVVGEDQTHVTAAGTCFDLERNVAFRVRVKRRITTKDGKRYDDDMITVTANAALSIALRNAVLKTIPQALTRPVYEAARKASVGEGATLTKTRENALAWFAKLGLSNEKIFELLNVAGVNDIGQEDVITLRGLMTAIKDGDISVESILNEGMAAETAKGMDALKQKLDQKKAEQAVKKKSTKRTKKNQNEPTQEPAEPEKQGEGEPLPEDKKVAALRGAQPSDPDPEPPAEEEQPPLYEDEGDAKIPWS